MKVKNIKYNLGFTIVELLVIISVISIFGTMVYATLDPLGQIKKGTDAKRKSDLALIQRALEEYYNDNRTYPAGVTSPAASAGQIAGTAGWNTQWNVGTTVYMRTLPKDSDNNGQKRYYYRQVNGGQGYVIYASLDRGDKDPQACNSGAACSSVSSNFGGTSPAIPGNSCSVPPAVTHICNFALSSPNVTP